MSLSIQEKPNEALAEWIRKGPVDWSQVLRSGNEYYDRIAAAAHKPTYSEKDGAIQIVVEEGTLRLIEEAEKELKRLEAATKHAKARPSGDAAKGIGGLSTATMILATVGPRSISGWNPRELLYFDRTATAKTRLTKAALALAAYRADNNRYPEKLGSLVPDYLKRLPEDPYGKGTFCYRREKEGFLLYSVGPNGKDNTGPLPSDSSYVVPPAPPSWANSDDIGIRIPDQR